MTWVIVAPFAVSTTSGVVRADARGARPRDADGIAGSGHGHAAGPHDAGLHHAGRQPPRRARPELPARLLAAGRHARQRLRVPQRLALVRRRRGIQPGLGLRSIPVDSVRGTAGLDHEFRAPLRGPGCDVLGRDLLGSALSQSAVVPPASTATIRPIARTAASPSSAPSSAAPSSTAHGKAAGRGASSRTTAVGRSAATGPGAQVMERGRLRSRGRPGCRGQASLAILKVQAVLAPCAIRTCESKPR